MKGNFTSSRMAVGGTGGVTAEGLAAGVGAWSVGSGAVGALHVLQETCEEGYAGCLHVRSIASPESPKCDMATQATEKRPLGVKERTKSA